MNAPGCLHEAENRPDEPDPGNAGEGSDGRPHAVRRDRAGAGAASGARPASTTALLWGSLGVSLLVIVVGALLVPALSLRDAILATLLGGLVGNAMLAAAGLIGADARVPGWC